MSTKVAVVTGSNKGIGFEIVKGLCEKFPGSVYLTARNEERGRKAVQRLEEMGYKPLFHLLDVTSEASIQEFANHVTTHHSGIDVLVNNAGILDFDKSVSSYEDSKKLLDTNFYSLLTITRILYPLLTNTARIVNLSSDWGLLSNINKQVWLDVLNKDDLTVDEILQFVDDFLEAAKNGKKSFISFAGYYGDYKVSKVALSALTFVQQKQFIEQGKDISINCVHPGFVKSDMTKGRGNFTPERGARTPLYLLLEAPQSHKGTFVWHDGHQVNWDD
ncbi:carbonyl reductase [NADPH] 3-like [Danaus plexippus]|uniref:Carbonyl reductase n=1 Tax=Danaus plexippus plexippus TaxID=278856 RepID=A0A212FD48_DANPL|nr:carbonyl reductase [NADPH] 3-like [Danaus plexippus]OWR51675.1 Carbonyl reductase [Danaus plexippus plexippus]